MTFLERKAEICRNVYQKLCGLEVSFGLPEYTDNMTDKKVMNYINTAWNDAQRFFGFTEETFDSVIPPMSNLERIFEDRIVYFKIKQFRYKSAGFFKFSSSIDGRTIDKTKVHDYLKSVLNDLDADYKEYLRSNKYTGNVWHRTYNDFHYSYYGE